MNEMARYKCLNKRCKFEFIMTDCWDEEVRCPLCGGSVEHSIEDLNIQIDTHIDTAMVRNVNLYGAEGAFRKIDELFPKWNQRIQYRKALFQAIAKHKFHFDLDKFPLPDLDKD